ncbi:MAG: 30S ribosomal protein S3 [Patescibacteria group bacterium]|nr:30S ribosomal protein S3 [Patescibacteria group bacterium]
MGKKINPISFRLGIGTNWSSRWFKAGNYADFLKEDLAIRDLILKKLKAGAIKDVKIERFENSLKVRILAGRPGVIIGRGGSGIEEIKNDLKGLLMSIQSVKRKETDREKEKTNKPSLEIEVEEVKNFEENAALVAQSIAEQLEKRVPFRRVLKTAIDSVSKQRGVKGVKIMVKGRLNGTEMSRREWSIKGGIPLHTLRANIDYAKANAYTTYGVIGVKVWIYKGEMFRKNREESK